MNPFAQSGAKPAQFKPLEGKEKADWLAELDARKELGKKPVEEQYEAFLRGDKGTGWIKDSRAVMDLAKAEILEFRAGKKTASKTANRPAESPEVKAKADAAIAAHAASKAAAAAAPAAKPAAELTGLQRTVAAFQAQTMTAEQFRASQAKPTMARAEWEKLSHPEKNAFFRNGGKLSA